MRIAINCHSFLSKSCYAGIGRYTYNLVKTLSEIDSQNSYLLYGRKFFFPFRKNAPPLAGKNFVYRMDHFKRGCERAIGPVDIYHAPAPEVLEWNGIKTVVTVHDLVHKAFAQAHTADTISRTENNLQRIVARADRIICCSQSTLNDLNQHFSVSPLKVKLIYQGVDKNIFYPIDEKESAQAEDFLTSLRIRGPFILFVGTIEPRKNLANLLRAVALLKQKAKFSGQLVVVGMKGWMSEDIAGLIKQCQISDQVVLAGYITNDQLRYLYNKTEVFVFPSFYEGFGFPIVEAFSCGAAVVTSNVSSCPEIASDAAFTVDPKSPQAIFEAIHEILDDKTLRASLKTRGLKRAEDFSFVKTAQETAEVYLSLKS